MRADCASCLAAKTAEDNDPQRRKAREKAAILKSDMDNAASLFGSTSLAGSFGDDLQCPQLLTRLLTGEENPLTMRCDNKDDFEALAESLSSAIVSSHGSHPLYALFVENFFKQMCGPLRDVETRKVASALTALGNEKQKAQKDAAGGKKKKAAKPALGATKGIGAGRADVGAYDEILDDSGDYDDFVSSDSLLAESLADLFLFTDVIASLHLRYIPSLLLPWRCRVVLLPLTSQ